MLDGESPPNSTVDGNESRAGAQLGGHHKAVQTSAKLWQLKPFGPMTRIQHRELLNLPEEDVVNLEPLHLSGVEPGCEAPRWATTAWPPLAPGFNYQVTREVTAETRVTVRKGLWCTSRRERAVSYTHLTLPTICSV